MTPTPKDTAIVPLSIMRMPISHAFVWIKNAITLIKAQPLIILLASTWIIFVEMLLTGILPGVGMVLFLLIAPALAFGMADVCQSIRIQENTSPLAIFSPLFNKVRNRLLSLGLIYATILFGVFLISQTAIDQNALNETFKNVLALQEIDNLETMRTQSKEVWAQLMEQKGLFLAFGMMIAGSMLIQTLLMYSPLFTVWQNAQAPQAVWLSIRTIFINILPIGLTIVLIFGVFAALSLIISILGMRTPSLMMFIIMGLWVLFNAVVNAVTYTSYYDIIRTSLTNSVQGNIDQILDGSAKDRNAG